MIKYIFFWGPNNLYPEFSQWYLSDFTAMEPRFSDDESPILRSLILKKYNCAEKYMMSKKAELFNDKETYANIMATNSPREQKKLGRKVAGFDVDVWRKHCEKIVEDGNFYKFSQNDKLKDLLLSTDNAILVEASPYDKIWGIGLAPDDPNINDETKWRGENLLGKALMKVRESLKG